MHIDIPVGFSTAIQDLRVWPLTGKVEVTFWKSWPTYRIEGVSRRAIAQLITKSLLRPMPELGAWVNTHVVAEGRWVGCA